MSNKQEEIQLLKSICKGMGNAYIEEFQVAINKCVSNPELPDGTIESLIQQFDANYEKIKSEMVNNNPYKANDYIVQVVAEKARFNDIEQKDIEQKINEFQHGTYMSMSDTSNASASASAGAGAQDEPVYLDVGQVAGDLYRERPSPQNATKEYNFNELPKGLKRIGAKKFSRRAAKAVRKEMKQCDENTNNRAAPNDSAPDPYIHPKPK